MITSYETELTKAEEATMITVWGQPNCQPCKMAVRRFDREGVAYQYKDLTDENNAAKRDALLADGHQQSPIIETPSETFAGYNPSKISTAIAEAHTTSATLDPALDRSGPAVA